MRANHSILERNMLHALSDSEAGTTMFCRLLDRVGPHVAEEAAYEAKALDDALGVMLPLAAAGLANREPHIAVAPATLADLRRYHLDRLYRKYAPNN